MSFIRTSHLLCFLFCVGWNLQSNAQDTTHNTVDTSIIDSVLVDSSQSTIDVKPTRYQLQKEEFTFVLYLISSELYDDALYALNRLNTDSIANPNMQDSVNYYIGWIKYFKQDFHGAIASFSAVESSSVVVASSFYNSICYIQIDSLAKARYVLQNLDVSSDAKLDNLKILQLRGISLLERDFTSYDSLSALSVERSFVTESEMNEMTNYADLMRSYKRKSPWIAGLLSAIVPGLGKFYAGYRGTPFGAMYMTIPLGAIAAESLIIAGVASLQFIALGALFGVFYVGNVWGSVLSVYAKEQEFYEELDHNIEFDLHTPVRRAFR
jgi:hypothetical protein